MYGIYSLFRICSNCCWQYTDSIRCEHFFLLFRLEKQLLILCFVILNADISFKFEQLVLFEMMNKSRYFDAIGFEMFIFQWIFNTFHLPVGFNSLWWTLFRFMKWIIYFKQLFYQKWWFLCGFTSFARFNI